MLNKKDPLIDAIQQVMQSNQADRAAVKVVNEKFGIQDRRVLPRERQGEWDAAYQTVLSEGVEALDEKIKMSKQQFANLDGKPGFTANDLEHARAGTHRKKAAAGSLEEGEKPDPVGKNENEGGSAVTTVPSKPKSVTPADQSALKKKIMSIKEAKKAAMCEDTLDEKLTKSMSAGKVISDFVHSDNPKFAGKSKKKRTEMALGAYYSKHPEKSKKLEETTLQSIQEEIANNLAEQASYIYENEGQEGLINFMESLSEEQISILQEAGIWDTIKSAASSATNYVKRKAADTATAVLGPERSATVQSFVKGTTVGKERKQEMQKGNMSSSEYRAGPRDTSGSTAPKPKSKPAAPAPKAAAPKAAAPAAPVAKAKPRLQSRYERDNIGPSGRPTKGPGGVTTGTTIKK